MKDANEWYSSAGIVPDLGNRIQWMIRTGKILTFTLANDYYQIHTIEDCTRSRFPVHSFRFFSVNWCNPWNIWMLVSNPTFKRKAHDFVQHAVFSTVNRKLQTVNGHLFSLIPEQPATEQSPFETDHSYYTDQRWAGFLTGNRWP